LGPVGGRSVGEFDVEDGVPERKLPRARRPDEMHGAVVAHPGDDPGVAVGDAEVVVVAPGSDSVADPDSLTAVGDEHTAEERPRRGTEPRRVRCAPSGPV